MVQSVARFIHDGWDLIYFQHAKIHNSLIIAHSARNLGFVFDEHLTLSDQTTLLSKAYCYDIRQLRRIRPYLNASTLCTIIASSVVHFKL